ncbi:MAG: PIG-L family deacetylase [Paracoccaceae bacterium]
MRIVVVTAHPDDAEISAGGMILAWRAIGASVTILCATDGAKGGSTPGPALAQRRAAEARAGAALLGAQLEMMGHPDGVLSEAGGFAADLTGRLARLAPDLVLAHAANDYHPDHRAVAEAARRACGFSVPLAWLETAMGTGFLPTHYIDTTAHQPTKETALRQHASQDPERFVESSRLLARLRAAQCGFDGFAECLRHEPVYPFADIRGLLPSAPPIRPVRDRSRPQPEHKEPQQ